MAHLGLTPQSVHAMGGYRVQGRTDEDAHRLMEQAMGMEKAGAFSLVLEGIPSELGGEITRALEIPTIGIGAGPDCDGQVLVLTDLLGMGSGHYPSSRSPTPTSARRSHAPSRRTLVTWRAAGSPTRSTRTTSPAAGA